MNRFRLFFSFVTTLAGVALIVALFHRSGQDIGHVAKLVRTIDLRWGSLVLAGMAINIVLAAEKWRRVESCLTETGQPLDKAIALTALAGALGQVLPTPVASATVRGFGNRLSHRSCRHGVLASGWEQLFDLGAALLLAGPALLFLLGYGWAAIAMSCLATLIIGESCAVAVPRLIIRFARINPAIAAPALCKFLWRLSLMRTMILILVSVGIGRAVNADIHELLIAAAVPPVILAATLSFVPAGIGVNELSFVGLLALGGVPMSASASFALVNRALQMGIALLLGIFGLVMLNRRLVRFGLGRGQRSVMPTTAA